MTIQERIQAQEQEAYAYQQSMTPQWSSIDSLFRHVNQCVDSDCPTCFPFAGDDLFGGSEL